MSYAICNVICGCEANIKLLNYLSDFDIKPGDIGFVGLYSASGESPAYCGVRIYEFDECMSLKAYDLQLVPTSKQVEEATKLLKKAREKLAECLKQDEEPDFSLLQLIPEVPDVCLVWSSS